MGLKYLRLRLVIEIARLRLVIEIARLTPYGLDLF
jgi:hypothetical protein